MVTFSLSGAFLGLLESVVFAEFVDMVEQIPELKNSNVEKRNIALACFSNLMQSVSECAARLAAGFMSQFFGFEKAYMMVGSFVTFYGILYFFICGFGKEFEPEQKADLILYE